MSNFRQHLEVENLQSKYRVLTFYCNWNLHKDLDKGIVQDMLDSISNVIVEDTTGHPADRISEILSLSTLRVQIKEVLSNAGFESGLFEIYENWVAFTELMFPFLLEKPLKRTRKAQTHHWVESLKLYDSEGKLFWQIEVMPGNNLFHGPVLRTDPESARASVS